MLITLEPLLYISILRQYFIYISSCLHWRKHVGKMWTFFLEFEIKSGLYVFFGFYNLFLGFFSQGYIQVVYMFL